jgi:hypothetical protein
MQAARSSQPHSFLLNDAFGLRALSGIIEANVLYHSRCYYVDFSWSGRDIPPGIASASVRLYKMGLCLFLSLVDIQSPASMPRCSKTWNP